MKCLTYSTLKSWITDICEPGLQNQSEVAQACLGSNRQKYMGQNYHIFFYAKNN